MPIFMPASKVIVDDKPDERGNVMAAALLVAGRMIALTINAN